MKLPHRTRLNGPTSPAGPRKREPTSRRARGAIAAVLLAAVGASGLVAFVKGAEDRALAGERLVDVLVVKERIEAGTSVDEMKGDVRIEQVPAKTRAEGALTDLADVPGQVASVDLFPGEQVTGQRMITSAEFGRTGGQIDAPDNLLEVTVSLAPERAVGGVIRPGSTVGVVASFEAFDSSAPTDVDGVIVPQGGKTPNSTHLILHKVLVTNVQSAGVFQGPGGLGGEDEAEDGAPAQGPTENLLVTLALDAGAVERVVFAAEHGTIWLAYEPETASSEGTRVQTRGSIYQ